jgi:thioredoxin reductase (NADPH)
MAVYDVLVVGGGPAGLSAAIYAGRALRSVLVVDTVQGRWNHNQINENYLGFPRGISARKLRFNGKKQAEKFGAVFAEDAVQSIKRVKGIFKAKGMHATYAARSVILCTGVKDHFPSFQGAEKYVGRSLFWCLLCDGYKLQGKRVAVLGFDDEAVDTCLHLKDYTKDLIFLTNCDQDGDKISDHKRESLKAAKIEIRYGSIARVLGARGMLREIILDTGEQIKADVLFSRQGASPNVDLAQQLGIILEGKGYIKTDVNKRTNVPFVYAAGDVTSETAHQIIVAAAEGAGAAIAANHDLRDFMGTAH